MPQYILDKEFPMDKLKIIESYAQRISQANELVESNNKASASRLVWFVAIAGYAFLNVPVYIKALSDEPVSGVALVVITIPWALTALLGIVTHWLLGELIDLDIIWYITYMADINAFIVTKDGEVTDRQLLDLLDEKDKNVQARRKNVERFKPWVQWAERLTFFFLCMSFVWSVACALALTKPS
jgi:ribose/xylose/arabinose/galactoside ABC-type transport system permease subunit